MNTDKWEQIKGRIEDDFEVEERGERHDDEMGGVDINFIVFKSPLGRVKLEFILKPVILDRKTNYSNRIGSGTKVEYVYSDTEKSERMVAYKWDEVRDGWVEMDAKAFE